MHLKPEFADTRMCKCGAPAAIIGDQFDVFEYGTTVTKFRARPVTAENRTTRTHVCTRDFDGATYGCGAITVSDTRHVRPEDMPKECWEGEDGGTRPIPDISGDMKMRSAGDVVTGAER